MRFGTFLQTICKRAVSERRVDTGPHVADERSKFAMCVAQNAKEAPDGRRRECERADERGEDEKS
jgi:hypothetical protein